MSIHIHPKKVHTWNNDRIVFYQVESTATNYQTTPCNLTYEWCWKNPITQIWGSQKPWLNTVVWSLSFEAVEAWVVNHFPFFFSKHPKGTLEFLSIINRLQTLGMASMGLEGSKPPLSWHFRAPWGPWSERKKTPRRVEFLFPKRCWFTVGSNY